MNIRIEEQEKINNCLKNDLVEDLSNYLKVRSIPAFRVVDALRVNNLVLSIPMSELLIINYKLKGIDLILRALKDENNFKYIFDRSDILDQTSILNKLNSFIDRPVLLEHIVKSMSVQDVSIFNQVFGNTILYCLNNNLADSFKVMLPFAKDKILNKIVSLSSAMHIKSELKEYINAYKLVKDEKNIFESALLPINKKKSKGI